jgi:hypothetical protein
VLQDLADAVGADLDVMEADAARMRGEGPTVLAAVKQGRGVPEIEVHLLAAWRAATGNALGSCGRGMGWGGWLVRGEERERERGRGSINQRTLSECVPRAVSSSVLTQWVGCHPSNIYYNEERESYL